jgi:hypothetical protein
VIGILNGKGFRNKSVKEVPEDIRCFNSNSLTFTFRPTIINKFVDGGKKLPHLNKSVLGKNILQYMGLNEINRKGINTDI